MSTPTEIDRVLRVFLCYASEDVTVVRRLYRWLEARGCAVWFDKENLLPGHHWETEIRKAVKATDVVLVCLSSTAVNKTGFIQKEMKLVLEVAREQPSGTVFVMPLKLESCDTPEEFSHLHVTELYGSKSKKRNAYTQLQRALKHRAEELGVQLPIRQKKDRAPRSKPTADSPKALPGNAPVTVAYSPTENSDIPQIVVLFAHSDKNLAGVFAVGLSSRGFAVHTVNNGREVINMVRSVKPDVIVLDIPLPGLDGLEVMRRLKQERMLRDIPVLIATAYSGAESKALEAGADEFVLYPITPKAMAERLHQLVERSTGIPHGQ
jgi:CheY-like chemotaxis protein